jgi:pilus assembly protein CpaD
MPRKPSRLSRALPLGALLLAGAALAGCGVDYASDDTPLTGDYHERHPIVVAQAPTTLDVYPVGEAIDAESVAKIKEFVSHYRQFGTGPITILTPVSHGERSTAVVDQIRRTLAATGLRGYVGVGAYPVADATRASPVRLFYQGLKAVTPTRCGQWPDDLASGASIEGWKNEEYENYGCATQSVLAAQVADPRDFVQARASQPADVAMRMRAIGDVRNGQDPGTQWKIQLTPIGVVGGGG